MKQLLIMCAALLCFHAGYAQAEASNSKWPEHAKDQQAMSAESDFSKTSMAIHSRKVSFLNLPQLDKPATVTITNKDGEMVMQTKVNPVNNVVDIRYLDKGTYFINLLYKKEQKKGFVLNL